MSAYQKVSNDPSARTSGFAILMEGVACQMGCFFAQGIEMNAQLIKCCRCRLTGREGTRNLGKDDITNDETTSAGRVLEQLSGSGAELRVSGKEVQ